MKILILVVSSIRLMCVGHETHTPNRKWEIQPMTVSLR